MLLSGRAGIGKTTLAQTIARHCGYNIIEINASDDRTGDSLKNTLYQALESSCIKNGKPNLVIIDEIDGASHTSADQVFC
jgi:chromosome transmission fidelity protein 18